MSAPHPAHVPGSGYSDPGVPSRWLFHYHPHMVAEPLRAATPVRRMTIGEPFVDQHVTRWGSDLLSFPMLSPRFCQLLIDASDALGTWGPASGDDFGAPELRLACITPRLKHILTEVIHRHVNPLLRREFLGMYQAKHVEPPFLIRYDMATQQEMGLHFDGQSDVSFAVSLNTEFSGGGLRFPRQGATLRQLPVGHALMFPGGPTHLHEALPIEAGVRRSLTIWTRASGD